MNRLIIYRIVNTKTGMSYIGQTRNGLARRKSEHLSRLAAGERDHALYEAMRRDGVETFKFEVICHALSVDHLDELERTLVAQHKTYTAGYNMTPGGEGVSDGARAKISAKLKGRDVSSWISKTWESRRRNGTDKLDMSQYVPSGEANSRAKSYLIETPQGRLLAITGLKAFCREHGLTPKAMYDTLNGVQAHHKGYKLLSALGAGRSSTEGKYSDDASLMGAQ